MFLYLHHGTACMPMQSAEKADIYCALRDCASGRVAFFSAVPMSFLEFRHSTLILMEGFCRDTQDSGRLMAQGTTVLVSHDCAQHGMKSGIAGPCLTCRAPACLQPWGGCLLACMRFSPGTAPVRVPPINTPMRETTMRGRRTANYRGETNEMTSVVWIQCLKSLALSMS